MGQLRSELTCPDCGNISVQFDPYTSLSLPIAGPRHRKMAITVQAQPKAPRETITEGIKEVIKLGRKQDYYTARTTYSKIYDTLVRNTDVRVLVERTGTISDMVEGTKALVLNQEPTEVRAFNYKERGTVGVAVHLDDSVKSIPGRHWMLCI